MDRHGMSNTRLYRTWNGMVQRCTNPNNAEYGNYGGRGVQIYPEWRDSFRAFAAWALLQGYKTNLTIERKDVDGNYEPENCCWIPMGEQSINRRCVERYTINGKEMALPEIEKELGINYKTLHKRKVEGLPILMPLQDKRKPVIRSDGAIFLSIAEAARAVNAQESKVGEVCRGVRKRTRGYSFQFLPPEAAEAALAAKEGE